MDNVAQVIAFVGILVFMAHLFTGIFSRTRIPDVILLIIIGICVVAALALNVQADIGARVRSTGGAFANGGSWGGGPYPVNGSLVQLIWSPVDLSAAPVGPTLLNAGEELMWEGTSQSYGYILFRDGGFRFEKIKRIHMHYLFIWWGNIVAGSSRPGYIVVSVMVLFDFAFSWLSSQEA